MENLKEVPQGVMVGPHSPSSGGRPPRLTVELRRRLSTLRKGRVLLIPDDPDQPSSGRGYLHDMQVLIHSFARRNNLKGFSTWKADDPETGENVLAVAVREERK